MMHRTEKLVIKQKRLQVIKLIVLSWPSIFLTTFLHQASGTSFECKWVQTKFVTRLQSKFSLETRATTICEVQCLASLLCYIMEPCDRSRQFICMRSQLQLCFFGHFGKNNVTPVCLVGACNIKSLSYLCVRITDYLKKKM